jgi:hypothetical protein
MNRIDPANLLGLLCLIDIKIHNHGLVVAANQNAFKRLVRTSIDLLVRHVDEIAWTRVCTENLICVGGTTESPKLTE